MDNKKLEYDATVGGAVKLNSTISTYNYAAEALAELKSLTAKATDKTSVPGTSASAVRNNNNKLIFQTLPVHMRRRAMSHHPKRLPRKYRTAHCTQMSKAGAPGKSKRPSRKYRRRPSNLKRNGTDRRLETHTWHAKRFKMVKRWGYRLPLASNNKTFHACYRATKDHCLMQDVSYLRLIQVRGYFDLLREKLGQIVDTGKLSMTANIHMCGLFEGECDIFKIGKHPYCALQRVRFMWRPPSEEKDGQRTLWLWVHPSTYLLVRDEIIAVLELKLLNTKIIHHADKRSVIVKSPSNLTNQTYVHQHKNFELQELTGNFNRFRLTGPLCNAVMAAAFKAAKFSFETFKWKWFQEAYKGDQMACLDEQATFWCHVNSLSTPGVLSSHMILSLVVEDPRIHRPSKRTKAIPADEFLVADSIIPEVTNEYNNIESSSLLHVGSVLWQAKNIAYLQKNMLSTSAYDKLRAKHVAVPGAAELQFERESLQPLPLLLIQNPGNVMGNSTVEGFAAGWDIIIPSGYGMNVWLALLMNGALAGGLRETDTICRQLCIDEHLPDTMSALLIARERSLKLREKFFRMPPNKRTNYRKYQVATPFGINFAQLCHEWRNECLSRRANVSSLLPRCNEFCVLRNFGILHKVRAFILRDSRMKQSFASVAKYWPPNLPLLSIIQVEVRMCKRGELKDFAMICIPLHEDVTKYLSNSNMTIVMKTAADTNANARAKLRMEHKLKLKRLRARRVREKRKLQKFTNKRVHISPAKTSTLCAKYWQEMCKLWLPEPPKLNPIGKKFASQFYLRKQGEREVIGYVTKGGFSFIKGISTGVAYITENGLKGLLKKDLEVNYRTPMVLVRNPNNNYYRFATIDINLKV